MSGAIDTTNYVAVLSNASSLYTKGQKLEKKRDPELGGGKKKKTKSFLDSFLALRAHDTKLENNEFDYEKKLEGLNSSDRRKIIGDIIADLQDKVYSSGANLADTVNTQTIEEYKKAVKKFVNFAVKNSLDVRSVASGGYNMLKQKKSSQKNYTTVKVIDEKIERLTKELLFNQLEKLDILERLDEIKGLLVDLIT